VTIGPCEGSGKLTEKQAERFAWDHYLAKVDQIALHPRSLMTIAEFWEKHYKPAALLKLKKTSRDQYFSLYAQWIEPVIGRKRQATLETGDVEQAIARAIGAGKSPSTARHIRKVISAIHTKAKKVFCSRRGTPVNQNNVRRRVLAVIGKTLNLTRLSWHIFRYSHATFTESIGMHARDRQALMGHGALDQTDRYTMEDLERMRRGLDKIAGMILPAGDRVQ
jgi:hypothetical protein